MPHLPHCWFCPGSGEGRIGSSLLLAIAVFISVFAGAAAAQTTGDGAGAGSVSGSVTERTVRAVHESELTQVVRSHIVSTSPWRPDEIEVLSIRNLDGLRIPDGVAAFRVVQKEAPSNYRAALLSVEVSVDGRFNRMIWISAEVRIRAAVVQAARRLNYGSAVTEGDLRVASTEITHARNPYIRDVRDAVGRVLRRVVAEGEPLMETALAEPVLVRSGDTVRLRLQRSGIYLSALARAEQNGKLGQFVRIRNLDFSRTLRAQVVGRGEVAIQ